MNSTELLRQNKELAAWWIQTFHDPKFDQIVALTRAQLAESEIEKTEMHGVNLCLMTFQTLGDDNTFLREEPTTGLIHDIDEYVRTHEIPKFKPKSD
jgi:hypothetical protein